MALKAFINWAIKLWLLIRTQSFFLNKKLNVFSQTNLEMSTTFFTFLCQLLFCFVSFSTSSASLLLEEVKESKTCNQHFFCVHFKHCTCPLIINDTSVKTKFMLVKRRTHTHTHTHRYIYIYIYTLQIELWNKNKCKQPLTFQRVPKTSHWCFTILIPAIKAQLYDVLSLYVSTLTLSKCLSVSLFFNLYLCTK